ncbi:MAG: PP2C family serine/threonine-protein phosphatase [Deferrisomatales bacterium]
MPVAGTVTAHTAPGPRPHQEDRYAVARVSGPGGAEGWLLAVFDGHGGSTAADLCAGVTPRVFELRGPEDAEAALRRLVAGLDSLTRGMRSGTTVSAACVLESHGRAAVAVVGDSPVLAVARGGRTVVGPDHNARSNPAERAAAEARGGVYDPSGYLLNPATGRGLQMARALGDAALGPVLSREPEVFSLDLGPGNVLVLATDGLLDPAHGDTAGRAAELLALRRLGEGFTAQALVAWAEAGGLWDNATAVVWRAGEGGGE